MGIQEIRALVLRVAGSTTQPSVPQPEPGCLPNGCPYLLEVDHAEQAIRITRRSRGEEQLVGLAIRSASLAESQRPKTIDVDDFVGCVLELGHELPSLGIEGIDAAIAQVPDQQGVACGAKVLGGQRHAPRSLEVGVLCERLNQFSRGIENIHGASAAKTCRKGYEQLAIDVLNVISLHAGKLRIRERTNQLEGVIIDVNLVVQIVGAKKEVGAIADASGQAGIPCVCVDHNYGGVRIHGRIPAADRTGFKGGENE